MPPNRTFFPVLRFVAEPSGGAGAPVRRMHVNVYMARANECASGAL